LFPRIHSKWPNKSARKANHLSPETCGRGIRRHCQTTVAAHGHRPDARRPQSANQVTEYRSYSEGFVIQSIPRRHSSALFCKTVGCGQSPWLPARNAPHSKYRCTHRRGAFRGMRTLGSSNILITRFAAMDKDLLGFARHCTDAAPIIIKASRAESSTCRSLL
jgi:hypothetical protein